MGSGAIGICEILVTARAPLPYRTFIGKTGKTAAVIGNITSASASAADKGLGKILYGPGAVKARALSSRHVKLSGTALLKHLPHVPKEPLMVYPGRQIPL